ncbi:hypothetical protein Q765_13755 [Flavobacterium rivuli WB 3.3-2 = DSM 21788]|uniref:HTH araC/xylS-type domain-containing protein n=1 Tax=Flavobacterium rivuli WB 3.3-2 = DSM 21788 TaxID=1121895 RepID=A0A0A2M341_9FLAO|nr:helix-turn-helix domain-containing protein [Flavobacterium rivuli]KGO85893.1 hypothetical protein Q765_13755 [Flavobacterium rivuli WB 3.3-2 = DSM 21788]
MKKGTGIQLVEMTEHAHGIAIAPMSSDYLDQGLDDQSSDAHRHDFYTLFILDGGFLSFNVDFEPVSMEPLSLLLINPGQIHHCTSYRDISGWVMAFDAKLIDQKSRNELGQALRQIVTKRLNQDETTVLSQLLALLYQGSQNNTSGEFRMQYLQSLLNAVFYYIVNLFQSLDSEAAASHSPRAITITRQFQQLVKEQCITWKKPAQYAYQMNISVSYLNDTLKTVTGLSSTHFIQQEIIYEARRLLVYTNQSVKEIAATLGYDDYKYFIRIFSKMAKTSPAKFRLSEKGNKA